MSIPSTGQFYGDKERTPVPFPAYRCKSEAIEQRPHAPHSTYTHRCKVTTDHVGAHRCACGRVWPRAKDVTA